MTSMLGICPRYSLFLAHDDIALAALLKLHPLCTGIMRGQRAVCGIEYSLEEQDENTQAASSKLLAIYVWLVSNRGTVWGIELVFRWHDEIVQVASSKLLAACTGMMRDRALALQAECEKSLAIPVSVYFGDCCGHCHVCEIDRATLALRSEAPAKYVAVIVRHSIDYLVQWPSSFGQSRLLRILWTQGHHSEKASDLDSISRGHDH